MLSLSLPEAVPIRSLKPAELLNLQEVLAQLEYYTGLLDGIFGNKTKEAFNNFKEDHKLTEPDLIGPTTIKILQLSLTEFDKKEHEEAKSSQPVFGVRGQVIPTAINWNDFDCPISRFFTVGEVSQWSQERIVSDPTIKKNVLMLAKELDHIRELWGSPIGVTSWYRPPAVNRRVGGAKYSTHLTGSGVDIFPVGGNVYSFQKWLDGRWSKALGYGAVKKFVHIDLRSTPARIRWPY